MVDPLKLDPLDAVVLAAHALKHAMLLGPDHSGADVGMGVPGTDGRDVFFHAASTNAVEARTFTDQALFCDRPSACVYISGITY